MNRSLKEVSSLVGKSLLVGVTVLDESANVIEQFQVYGDIVRADGEGITFFREHSSTEFSIPPSFSNVIEADAGEYRLRSTGELVENPDYLTTWTIYDGSRKRLDEYKNHGMRGWE